MTFGEDIDSFINYCSLINESSSFYFHNLKFDGEFIIHYLLTHGFVHVNEKKLGVNQFSTIISDLNVFYCIKVKFKEEVIISFFDSLKLLNFSVEEVAKAFNLSIKKLEIDYKAKREKGHKITDDEKEYLKHDVMIMSLALEKMFEMKITRMTIASNAMNFFKDTISKKRFEEWFKPPLYDKDLRQAYKGGFTYLNEIYRGKEVKEGIVLDVNSLYPSVMYYSPMPYGEGIYFDGKYVPDKLYNLYIQNITCQFRIKKDMIPTIQIKNNLSFVPTEYLLSSNGESINLTLTNVDLKLFLEHYDIYDVSYNWGWKYKSSTKIFKRYIDYWNELKVKATKEGNKPLRTIAKLMLNSLYGKFAASPEGRSKIPYLDNNIVKYKLSELEERTAYYLPISIFITSWARDKTIRSAQAVYHRFIYADTDSLHLEGTDIPENLLISDTELGKWKIESTFKRGKYLRQKCYIEDAVTPVDEIEKFKKENPECLHLVSKDSIINIVCAGMPKGCYKNVTWENFDYGSVFDGKLGVKHTDGGIVLVDTTFTIKG
nr:MAG TPA: DNA polymerase B [Caudoviricetes sp.]